MADYIVKATSLLLFLESGNLYHFKCNNINTCLPPAEWREMICNPSGSSTPCSEQTDLGTSDLGCIGTGRDRIRGIPPGAAGRIAVDKMPRGRFHRVEE